jgi:glutaconate CoA-transferase subunit A
LIHVQRCDAYGNAQIDGLQFMDIDLAMAANKVILTTERIVSNDQIRRAPDQTKIPFFRGRRRGRSCRSVRAARMLRRLRADVPPHGVLRGLVNGDPVKGMQQYIERFVYGPKSWSEFLALIGIEELLEAARAGESIYDA